MLNKKINIKEIMSDHNGKMPSHGWDKIYDGPLVDSSPIIEGQIETPGKNSINRFKQLYLPVIDRYFDDKANIRILEIGAGLGNATYGSIELLNPELHIASEPFTSLLGTLRNNMDSWGYEWPRGIVAAYDANYKINLMENSVNLVLGNSVLHHILHWEECLTDLSRILDKRGLMVFGEPSYESWSYIITIIRSLLQQHGRMQNKTMSISRGSANDCYLSVKSHENLERFARNIEMRIKRRHDIEFLEKLEDKHLFSIPDLVEFANTQGLFFHIENMNEDFKKSFINKIKSQLETSDDVLIAKEFVENVIPSGISDCVLGNPFMVFSFYKP
ncbi:MAG: methyltransferase domain-containing protein [Methylococcaceae bacterium]|nr:methyltransferase domain-containing protein [Methylococcaceae bacterium]